MDEADWNFTEQQAETVWTCEQLRDKQGVKPHSDIMLDLFFAPIDGEEARREAQSDDVLLPEPVTVSGGEAQLVRIGQWFAVEIGQ